MPNIDSGHYYLTALVPILLSAELESDGSVATPTNRLRRLLTVMPTTGVDAAPTLYGQIQGDPRMSPFARNRLNHFVRFAVIEDVNYNGRISGDGIVEAVRGVDPAAPQAFDRLSRPYLLFAAEFDPNSHGAPELDVYLDKLWSTMGPELREIFRYCYGFAEVRTAGDFVRYIKRCQIETTMPFGDYWTVRPPLHMLPLAPVAVAGLGAALAAGYAAWRLAEPLGGWRWALAIPAALLAALAVALFMAKRHAAKSLPAAPHADLVTILKSLYLQRVFVAFAIAHQADDPAALHTAFGAFLDTHQPDEPEPSQPPAVVGA